MAKLKIKSHSQEKKYWKKKYPTKKIEDYKKPVKSKQVDFFTRKMKNSSDFSNYHK
jgi:hypothetical protein